MPLDDYHASATNWRGQLRANEKKTHLVIFLFIILYVVLGLIVDTIVLRSQYPHATVGQCLWALITLQKLPFATLLLGGIAGISLLVTYSMYDKIMLLGTDYHEITPETAKNLKEKQLYNVVEEMKVASGLKYMPKVFIIEADYMNAFASGYSEKSAMVAITRGLMEKLDRAELQAVMAHELSHIRHHDIKLTLMVAILSNILLIVVDIIFYNMIYNRDRKEDNRLFLIIMILRWVLPLLTVILALFLSRTREYMADAGAVELMRDNSPMARALLKISEDHEQHAQEYSQAYSQTAHEQIRRESYLYDPAALNPMQSVNSIFSTHPSISDRLSALGFIKKK